MAWQAATSSSRTASAAASTASGPSGAAASARRTPTARLTAVGPGGGDAVGGRGERRRRQGGRPAPRRARPATPSAGAPRTTSLRMASTSASTSSTATVRIGGQRGLVDQHDPAVDPVDRAGQHGSSLDAPHRWSGAASSSRSPACDRGNRAGSSVGRRVARRRPPGRALPGAVPPVSYVHARGRARHRGRRRRRASAGRLAARAGAPRRSPGGCRCSPTAPTAARRRSPGCGGSWGWAPTRWWCCGPAPTGVAAVWAAGLRARDGARPAVLAAAPGVVEDHAVWLATPDQIAVLDRCEGRDERFRLARLRTGSVVVDGAALAAHGARDAEVRGRAALGLPRPRGDPPPAAGRRRAGAVRGRAAGRRHGRSSASPRRATAWTPTR